MFEKLKQGQESSSNDDFTDAMKDVEPFGANNAVKLIESSTEPLAKLRERYPQELKEWCLNTRNNGNSEVSVIEIASKIMNFGYYPSYRDPKTGEEILYGTEIKSGPYLQAEDFLHKLRNKNPDSTVLMFKQEYDDGERSGEDYFCVVDTDLDELNLPEGYGYRPASIDSEVFYTTCEDENGNFTAEDDDFAICHSDTFLKSHNRKEGPVIFNEYNYNKVQNSETGQYFPEQFRIKVKKPVGK